MATDERTANSTWLCFGVSPCWPAQRSRGRNKQVNGGESCKTSSCRLNARVSFSLRSMTQENGTASPASLPRPTSASPGSARSSENASGATSERVKVIGNYILNGHTLGKGNFARVEEALHAATKAKVAVKIIITDKIKEEYVRKNLLREALIMRRLHHPNIIRLYETMKTRSLYCLVTECAEGGELLQHVKNDHPEKRLTETQARPFIRQLVSALLHMHENGIVHRDLKMENILLDKDKRHIKIVDFGLSNAREPGQFLSTHCGSPEYAAPELFIPGKVYGQEVDIWSLGVNMFAMLAGRLPFRVPRQGSNRRQRLLEQISAGVGPQQEHEGAHISKSAMDLIRLLLQPNPAERPGLREIMKHPWLTKNGLYPLDPYQRPVLDLLYRDRVMDLMCARLDVTRRQVQQSVDENRCDWIAAMFNLLLDQPDGQGHMRDVSRQQLASLMRTGIGQSGTVSLPTAGHSTLTASTVSDSSGAGSGKLAVATEASATPAAQPTSINAVVRQLEAAAGQPLKQTRPIRRHESHSSAQRPVHLQSSSLVRRHSAREQKDSDHHARSRFGLRWGAQDKAQQSDTSRPSSASAAVPVSTISAAPSIRSALQTRDKTQALPTRQGIVSSLTQQFSTSRTPLASSLTEEQEVVIDIGPQHQTSPQSTSDRNKVDEAGTSLYRSKRVSSYDGHNDDTVERVPLKKKHSFLRGRKSSREKVSSAAHEDMQEIQVLQELSESRNRMSAEFSAAPLSGAASLSRSFALKPKSLSTGDPPNALKLHQGQAISRSAHLSSITNEQFGAQAPQYGRAPLSSAWTKPAFSGQYNQYNQGQPPPVSVQPVRARQRPHTTSTGYPVGQLQRMPPPGFSDDPADSSRVLFQHHSDYTIAIEDMPRVDELEISGTQTLPSRVRKSGAFAGIFGKGRRMKKVSK